MLTRVMPTEEDRPLTHEEFVREWKAAHEEYFQVKDAALARLMARREDLRRRLLRRGRTE